MILFLFVYDPVLEGFWAWLRYLDNRRKNKPLTQPWDYLWTMVCYGVINAHVHISEIEREWREGTPYEYKGKRFLHPDIIGADLLDRR